jgi:LacI family transcriptional regulator
VARVLKGRGYVAPATRARIEQALASTNYRPNAVARGLRTQRSFTLGHLVSSLGGNPLFAEIARAVEVEAVRHGYNLTIVNLESDRARERSGVLQLIESRVAAMIFAHAEDETNLDLAIAAGIPVVQIERIRDRPTACVVTDNLVGCGEAMSHLLSLGHRRIGFIGADPALYPHAGPRKLSIEQERLTTYLQHLGEAGIALDPSLLHLGRYPTHATIEANSGHAPGWREMQALLALHDPPTAVFVTGDLLATGVLQAIYAAGLRVPDDISIIGYDDNLAPYLSPPLTAVALPTPEMGQAACLLTLDCIANAQTPRIITLPTKLHLRASTAAPRR